MTDESMFEVFTASDGMPALRPKQPPKTIWLVEYQDLSFHEVWSYHRTEEGAKAALDDARALAMGSQFYRSCTFSISEQELGE